MILRKRVSKSRWGDQFDHREPLLRLDVGFKRSAIPDSIDRLADQYTKRFYLRHFANVTICGHGEGNLSVAPPYDDQNYDK